MAGAEFGTFTPGGGALSDPHQDSLRAYEHIESLCGQEEAILRVPEHEREPHHHERLKKVEQELDRAFERLRHRHATRGDAKSGDDKSS